MACCGLRKSRRVVPTVEDGELDHLGPGGEIDPGRLPLFQYLQPSELKKVRRAFFRRKFDKGDVIVTEGEIGRLFFVLDAGQARVTRHAILQNGTTVEEPLRIIGRWDFFGETALLPLDAPRTATVTALTPCVCLCLDRAAVRWLPATGRLQYPTYYAERWGVQGVNMSHALAVPAVGEEAEGGPAHTDAGPGMDRSPGSALLPPVPASPKSAELIEVLSGALSRSPLLHSYDPGHIRQLVERMHPRDVVEGEVVVTEGAEDSEMYVIETGSFRVLVCGTEIRTMGPGTAFGELALMHSCTRTATVRCATAGRVWVTDRETLAFLAAERLRLIASRLRKIAVFRERPDSEIAAMANVAQDEAVEGGSVICHQGEQGDKFYVILSGRVVVTKTEQGGQDEVEVARYGPGDYFGERALMLREPRAATVTAVDPEVLLLSITRDEFNMCMALPVRKAMAKRQCTFRELSKVHRDAAEYGLHGPAPLRQLELADFAMVRPLGEGGFGTVCLMQSRSTGEQLAFKAVSKEYVERKAQVKQILRERQVWASLHCNFVAQLRGTTRDGDFVYFGMEPLLGGDVFRRLRTLSRLPLAEAQFVLGCVALGIRYLHEHHVCYRDLKPENLIYDTRGYVKIVDFGFAKQVDGRTFTICGTPDYMAPEIISGRGHHMAADLWSFGILVFELLAGYAPYTVEGDNMGTYNRIVDAAPVTFPDKFPEAARDLVRRLLVRAADKRPRIESVLEHPFFAGMDWKELESSRVEPPYVPPRTSRSWASRRSTNGSKNSAQQAPLISDRKWKKYVDTGQEWDRVF